MSTRWLLPDVDDPVITVYFSDRIANLQRKSDDLEKQLAVAIQNYQMNQVWLPCNYSTHPHTLGLDSSMSLFSLV